MEAFTWYLEREGVKIGADEANAMLDARMSKKAFRMDMDTLLRPGLPKFDVDAASILVRASYFSHLP